MGQVEENAGAQWGESAKPAVWVEPYTQIWKRARQIPMLPSGCHALDPPAPKPDLPKFTWGMVAAPLLSLGLMALLYVLFFMIDDLIIFGSAAFAMTSSLGERYAKYFRPVGAAILILLGVLLLGCLYSGRFEILAPVCGVLW